MEKEIILVKVIFDYDEEPSDQIMKAYVEKAYTDIYNLYASLTNNELPKWNEEFDDTHESFSEEAYMSYIIDKEQNFVDEFINSALDAVGMKYLKEFYIGEEADLRMRFYDLDGTVKTMQMFLRKVEH